MGEHPAMIEHINRFVFPAAFSLLPPRMNSFEARTMMLAIGVQESDFRHRSQLNGPARGWWQFEPIGFLGVLEHHASKAYAYASLRSLGYPVGEVNGRIPAWAGSMVYTAIEHNDTLATIFARLLLWQHPDPLPTGQQEAYDYYLQMWRPGRPRPERWARSWAEAKRVVG